jgi:4-diphosphocytidyl-2-C-methyl-D-erythritol kinase
VKQAPPVSSPWEKTWPDRKRQHKGLGWIENDFERVVFPQHPSLAEIKRILAATGKPEAALYSALSGSGSALFGLYLTQRDAQAAQDRIERESQALGVRNTVITRTLPRRAYWDQMVEDSF